MTKIRTDAQALTAGVEYSHTGEDGLERDQFPIQGYDQGIIMVEHVGAGDVAVVIETSPDAMEVESANSTWIAEGNFIDSGSPSGNLEYYPVTANFGDTKNTKSGKIYIPLGSAKFRLGTSGTGAANIWITSTVLAEG